MPGSADERITPETAASSDTTGQRGNISRFLDRLRHRCPASNTSWPIRKGVPAYRPSSRSALSLRRPRWRVAEAMFVAPAIRSRLMARLRREAITWGP